MRRPELLAAIVSLGGLVGASPASGQTLSERCAATVQQALQEARDAQQAGDAARALEVARRVAAVQPTARLRGFMARQHYTLGQLSAALREARRCVQGLPGEPPSEPRTWLEQYCPALVENLERQGITAAPEPPPRGDAGEAALCPEEPESAPTPAQPVQSAPHMPGYTASSVDLPRVTPMPRVRPRSRAPGVGPWIVAGAGVASVITGGVFYALARNEHAESVRLCNGGGAACAMNGSVVDAYDQGRRYYYATWGLMIAGGAAVVGGALWYVLARSSSTGASTRTALRGFVLPTEGGAFVGVGGPL